MHYSFSDSGSYIGVNRVRLNLAYHGRNTTFDVPEASKFDGGAYAADIKVLEALPVWTGTPNGLSLWQNQKEAIALGAAYVRVSQQTGEPEGARRVAGNRGSSPC